jgi:hypothetical protein
MKYKNRFWSRFSLKEVKNRDRTGLSSTNPNPYGNGKPTHIHGILFDGSGRYSMGISLYTSSTIAYQAFKISANLFNSTCTTRDVEV